VVRAKAPALYYFMSRVFSAITCLCLLVRIDDAISLSQIPHPELVAKKVANDFKTVLIIGSSVDRYAVSSNYPHQSFAFKNQNLQHNAVFDGPRNVGIAVLQHPGVGLHGDLDGGFWNPSLVGHTVNNGTRGAWLPEGAAWENPSEAHWKFYSTRVVIDKAAKFGHAVLGTNTPDLVVVETSLWDLAGWWQQTGHQATPERLEQWCDKDLPYLLKRVTDVFTQSRVVFRTAPLVAPWNNEKWTQANFEAMHECVVRRSAGTGEVFEHVGVIDYHEIMDKLIASTAESSLQELWKADGYHPAALPGRLYLNEIFRLLGVEPLEGPDFSRRDLLEGEELSVEDEDYL